MSGQRRKSCRFFRAAAAVTAVLLCWPGTAAAAKSGGPGAALEEENRFDIAGMALWEEAQERQRNLPNVKAEIQGTWSLEYGGLKVNRSFSGGSDLDGLGTEQLSGQISFLSAGEETVYSFGGGKVTKNTGGAETVLVSDPAAWRELSENFMDRTTYDLSCVKWLRVSEHEEERADGSTVLSYELDGEKAAEQVEPAVKGWLEGMGLSLSGNEDWFRLDRAEGELTVSSSGYMAVDRIRAEAEIFLGQRTVKGTFEICIVYG